MRQELLELIVERGYIKRKETDQPFQLSSGKTSWTFIDFEQVSTYGPALPLIGKMVAQFLRPDVQAIGGPSHGADPIATATALAVGQGGAASLTFPDIHTFQVRRTNPYNDMRELAGWKRDGGKVAIVEDVVTTGRQVIEAIKMCRWSGLEVVQVIVIVDREEGGIQAIQDYVGQNVPVCALYSLKEIEAAVDHPLHRYPDTATEEQRDALVTGVDSLPGSEAIRVHTMELTPEQRRGLTVNIGRIPGFGEPVPAEPKGSYWEFLKQWGQFLKMKRQFDEHPPKRPFPTKLRR